MATRKKTPTSKQATLFDNIGKAPAKRKTATKKTATKKAPAKRKTATKKTATKKAPAKKKTPAQKLKDFFYNDANKMILEKNIQLKKYTSVRQKTPLINSRIAEIKKDILFAKSKIKKSNVKTIKVEVLPGAHKKVRGYAKKDATSVVKSRTAGRNSLAIEIDKKNKALLPGKRKSKNGKIYYESRVNRSDVAVYINGKLVRV